MGGRWHCRLEMVNGYRKEPEDVRAFCRRRGVMESGFDIAGGREEAGSRYWLTRIERNASKREEKVQKCQKMSPIRPITQSRTLGRAAVVSKLEVA